MQLLTYKAVAQKLSIHPKTVYRLLREDATFPRPVKLAGATNRWVEVDVEKWIESKRQQGEVNDDRNIGEEALCG